MEPFSENEIKQMRKATLEHWAAKYRKERERLDQVREAESLRLQAIENKMRSADNPLGAEFESWISRRAKQLKKIRALGQDADELKYLENQMEREIYQRSGRE